MNKQFFYNLHTLTSHHKNTFFRNYICYCLVLILLSILLLYSFEPQNKTKQIQEGLATEIIRFHVIANSDTAEDQSLKMEVKEAVTDALRPILEHAKNIDEARSIIVKHLDDLETISNTIIQQNGYTYTASAALEHAYFPLKVYGDLSLPPGNYESVRIKLGSAKGQNWWCIMYPPLCFVDATYSVVPETSKKQLKYVLKEDEYNAIQNKKDVHVKVKFKLLPFLNRFFDK